MVQSCSADVLAGRHTDNSSTLSSSYSLPRKMNRASLVGLGRFELPTSPLSGVRSNQLSYRPGNRGTKGDWFAPYDTTAGYPTDYQAIRVSARTFEDLSGFIGKEVIQPQVPLRLPCYDFTPVMNHKVVSALPKVKLPTSFAAHSHGVTGGVYKARERIHRSVLICDY